MAERPATRDPDSRRRAILEAAADLIRAGELGKLTHRKVAERAGVPLGSTTYYFATLDELAAGALELLAAELDRDLAEIDAQLVEHGATPEVVAEQLHSYLSDSHRVRTETALYLAGFERAELCTLGRRWFHGLVDVLAAHVGTETATAMAVFADGAAIHAVLHDEPLPLHLIESTARALMSPPTQGRPS